MDKGKIIQGIDLLDAIKFIDRKCNVHIAVLLGNLEDVLGKDTEYYKKVRKLVLDSFNSYKKSILMIIFGTDFESGN
jgi:hypothetical protein